MLRSFVELMRWLLSRDLKGVSPVDWGGEDPGKGSSRYRGPEEVTARRQAWLEE